MVCVGVTTVKGTRTSYSSQCIFSHVDSQKHLEVSISDSLSLTSYLNSIIKYCNWLYYSTVSLINIIHYIRLEWQHRK